MAPPVDAHLHRLVDRHHQQTDLDGEQLDVEQVDPDVARNDDALVEYALEDIRQARRLRSRRRRRDRRVEGSWCGRSLLLINHESPVVRRSTHVATHATEPLNSTGVVELDLVKSEK